MPVAARYGFTILIIGVRALMQVGLQAATGFIGLFLLLPGVFISGLLFDRASGFLAAIISIVISMFVRACSIFTKGPQLSEGRFIEIHPQ